jgi:flavin-dependent dehydrogenase
LTVNGDRYEAKSLIIAEGVTSRTARSLLGNYPREHLAMGMALDLEIDGDAGNRIEIHLIDTPTKRYRLHPDFPLNGWMFPHRSGANIGVVGKGASKEQLQRSVAGIQKRFSERCGPIISEGSISAHPIPIIPRRRLGTKRVLAVGDSAGFVNPLTGEGLTYSITSGKIAAQSVNERIGKGFFKEATRKYEAQCGEQILRDLNAARRISPILHRMVGIADVRRFFDNFSEDRLFTEICLRIARGEEDWRALMRRTIPAFPSLFFSSLS